MFVLVANRSCLVSSRNYSWPDPPGLFDGHVWPMYVKHKNIMEETGVDVGKCLSVAIPIQGVPPFGFDYPHAYRLTKPNAFDS